MSRRSRKGRSNGKVHNNQPRHMLRKGAAAEALAERKAERKAAKEAEQLAEDAKAAGSPAKAAAIREEDKELDAKIGGVDSSDVAARFHAGRMPAKSRRSQEEPYPHARDSACDTPAPRASSPTPIGDPDIERSPKSPMETRDEAESVTAGEAEPLDSAALHSGTRNDKRSQEDKDRVPEPDEGHGRRHPSQLLSSLLKPADPNTSIEETLNRIRAKQALLCEMKLDHLISEMCQDPGNKTHVADVNVIKMGERAAETLVGEAAERDEESEIEELSREERLLLRYREVEALRALQQCPGVEALSEEERATLAIKVADGAVSAEEVEALVASCSG